MRVIERYFVIVLWLLLLVSESHTQDNPNSQPTQSKDQTSTPVEPTIVEQQRANPDYYKISCERPENHDAADLCEQRRMAQAAEDSVYWARIQALIGGLGFGSVFVTLIFTGFGTRVASRQVRLSRHALVDTDRAFVYPKSASWVAAKDIKTDKIVHWLISAIWENSGNTPTRHLHIYISREVKDTILPENFEFPYQTTKEIPCFITPKNTFESVQLHISMDDMEAIVAGNKHLYLWGWAEYDDVFERTPRHRTEFCHKWFVNGDPRKNDMCFQRYIVHDRHNGADDECEYPLKTSSPKDRGDR